MYDVGLLLETNELVQRMPVRFLDGALLFQYDKETFDEYAIRSIIAFCNRVVRDYPIGIPIVFQFTEKIKFVNKLVFILFECVCKFMVSKGYPITLRMLPTLQINTHGFESSPLNLLISSKTTRTSRFEDKFEKDLFGRHYRGILSEEAAKENLSFIMGDVSTFQLIGNIAEDDRDMVAEVIAELVGNAQEHGKSDCLYDFDITPPYRKKGSDKKYRGLNIVIMNLSSKLLGTDLRQKLLETKQNELLGRYAQVLAAYTKHKDFWGELYKEEDFFNIAAFQNKISGRIENSCTGGTGLTKLIHSLEEKSDSYSCFVQSGKRQIKFEHEFMNYKDNWIGFNRSNNFLMCPPSDEILRESRIYLPGTAYNLTFVMETDDE